MASSKLIILSLLFLPLSLLAENASDYANRGAQKYIFGQEDLARAEVEEGLKKFPNDPELQKLHGLVKDKKRPNKNDNDKNKKQQRTEKKRSENEKENGVKLSGKIEKV